MFCSTQKPMFMATACGAHINTAAILVKLLRSKTFFFLSQLYNKKKVIRLLTKDGHECVILMVCSYSSISTSVLLRLNNKFNKIFNKILDSKCEKC